MKCETFAIGAESRAVASRITFKISRVFTTSVHMSSGFYRLEKIRFSYRNRCYSLLKPKKIPAT